MMSNREDDEGLAIQAIDQLVREPLEALSPNLTPNQRGRLGQGQELVDHRLDFDEKRGSHSRRAFAIVLGGASELRPGRCEVAVAPHSIS